MQDMFFCLDSDFSSFLFPRAVVQHTTQSVVGFVLSQYDGAQRREVRTDNFHPPHYVVFNLHTSNNYLMSYQQGETEWKEDYTIKNHRDLEIFV